MSDIEKNINEKKFSFTLSDAKWIITTGVAVVLWVSTAVMWVNDKEKQEQKIINLESHNNELQLKVATLEGQVSGVNQITEAFISTPPKANREMIMDLERRVEVLEKPGYNPPINNEAALDTSNVYRRNR